MSSPCTFTDLFHKELDQISADSDYVDLKHIRNMLASKHKHNLSVAIQVKTWINLTHMRSRQNNIHASY